MALLILAAIFIGVLTGSTFGWWIGCTEGYKRGLDDFDATLRKIRETKEIFISDGDAGSEK